jgi:uncharacterized protein (DUF433 family)
VHRHRNVKYCVTLLDRIEISPATMGGKPCIKGTRVTVGTVVGLFAEGHTEARILDLYPYLTAADVRQALAYAAWRVQEQEMLLTDPA